ncbi:MAG: aminotransferase class V-fold PLP-dependent enzyme [Planctomycetales bacterium]|nr:aminotransferase class V-fold PLP-dependent enzyme [Planctomycetales bacterium]
MSDSTTERIADRPAILGGKPARANGPPGWPRRDERVDAVLRSLIESGDWGRYHGEHVPALSRQLAEYHSVEQVLLTSSGTAAVELALRGVGVGPDDEVILAGYDFKANFQNVLCLRAIPVLVDVHPQTWQLDPERLAAAVTSRTKAIVASHLHGGAVPIREVRQFAEAHKIALIEDACQNPGAMIHERRAGTWGDVGVLSFGGSKLLTAGRGGAILTSRSDIAERIKRHTQRGNEAYPLSEMQAAVLRPQVEQLDELNERRCVNIVRLCLELSDMAGLRPLQLPTNELSPAYYKVGFQYRAEEFGGLPRELFVKSLRAEGVAFDTGFHGLHLIHAKRRFRAADDLIEATRADAGMLTLHHPVLLESAEAIDEIALAVRKVRDGAAEILTRVPLG